MLAASFPALDPDFCRDDERDAPRIGVPCAVAILLPRHAAAGRFSSPTIAV
jgi:hypothetical protein